VSEKNLDIAKTYANYIRDVQTQEQRLKQDETYRKQQEELSKQATVIQDSQALRRAGDSVARLKQNISNL